MSQSRFFGTFIFHSSDGKFDIPDGAESTTRRVPPKPAELRKSPPKTCGDVTPVDARDPDLRQVLVLNTDLFATLDEMNDYLRTGVGRALWAKCSNGVIYQVDASRGARTMSSKGGVPPKPAAAKAKPMKTKKVAKKPAGKGTAKAAKKVTKKATKKVMKKSGGRKIVRRMVPKARGGVPPKKAND